MSLYVVTLLLSIYSVSPETVLRLFTYLSCGCRNVTPLNVSLLLLISYNNRLYYILLINSCFCFCVIIYFLYLSIFFDATIIE